MFTHIYTHTPPNKHTQSIHSQNTHSINLYFSLPNKKKLTTFPFNSIAKLIIMITTTISLHLRGIIAKPTMFPRSHNLSIRCLFEDNFFLCVRSRQFCCRPQFCIFSFSFFRYTYNQKRMFSVFVMACVDIQGTTPYSYPTHTHTLTPLEKKLSFILLLIKTSHFL